MDVTPRISTALLRTQSDARLAELIAAGHERAFEAVVDRYERPLRRYCQRMLSDGLAEDVVQQAFLTAWSQLRNGQQIRELRPWLYRVAHNAALNTIKRAGYQYEQLHDTVPGADAPDAVLERSDSMRSTINALKELPDRQREALVRTAIDGESRTVVALDLGLSDGAVGQLLHRARSTLRSAATAITPLPLLTWLAGRHGLASPHLVGIGGGKAAGAGAGATAGGTSGTVAAGAGIVGSASSGAGIGIAGIAAKAAAVLAVGAVVGVAPVMAPRAFSSGSPKVDAALADDAVAGIQSDAASMRLAAAPAPASIVQEPSAGGAAPGGPGSSSPEAPAPASTTTDGTVTDATTDATAADATATDASTTDTSTEAATTTDTNASGSTTTDTAPADTTPTDTAPADTTPTDTTPTDTSASASTSASPPADTSASAAPPDPAAAAPTP